MRKHVCFIHYAVHQPARLKALLSAGLWIVISAGQRQFGTRTTTVPRDCHSARYLWTGASSSSRLTANLPEPRRCSEWTRVAPVRAAQSVREGRHSAPCRPETWWSIVPGANGPSWTGSSSTCWTEPGTLSASSAANATATSPRSASPETESSTVKWTFSGNDSGFKILQNSEQLLQQIHTLLRI